MMPVGYITIVDVEPDDIETLTGDNTIGLMSGVGELPTNAVIVDTERLRRLILAYREAFGDRHAHIGLVDTGDVRGLAMWSDREPGRAVVLAEVHDTGGDES